MNERQNLNRQLAQMLKGGVIMDVTTPEQARIAEEAGACAVMALERIPADIRAAGGVSRMSDPKMIRGIQEAVTIPVMAKCRIGHIAEAQILQAIEIDYIDESEVLSPADNIYHIDKTKFDVPFVCGAKNLGEALRRIAEGATMIRTKGEPGTGDVVQAVSHMRLMQSEIRRLVSMSEDELYEAAKQLQAPYELVRFVHENGKLPVVNFAAGGVATPADAALMMQLGAEGVFVGSGIFKSGNPAKRAAAIVQAVTKMRIAVLALQGAFIEHEQVLQRLGAETFQVRQLKDWQQPKDGLIRPGGESTVQMRLLSKLGLLEPIRQAVASGLPVFGTCAGMILLSEDHLGTMDIRVRRNAYGRQLGSFFTTGSVEGIGNDVPMTFIRAPYIETVLSPRCKAIATVDGHIVAARQGNQLATSFHPELGDQQSTPDMFAGSVLPTDDYRFHRYFLDMIHPS